MTEAREPLVVLMVHALGDSLAEGVAVAVKSLDELPPEVVSAILTAAVKSHALEHELPDPFMF